MKFSSVEEVEDLHHNKGAEDKCEMSRVNAVALQDCLILFVSVEGIKSPAANSASHHAIVPLKLGMTGENS